MLASTGSVLHQCGLGRLAKATRQVEPTYDQRGIAPIVNACIFVTFGRSFTLRRRHLTLYAFGVKSVSGGKSLPGKGGKQFARKHIAYTLTRLL